MAGQRLRSAVAVSAAIHFGILEYFLSRRPSLTRLSQDLQEVISFTRALHHFSPTAKVVLRLNHKQSQTFEIEKVSTSNLVFEKYVMNRLTDYLDRDSRWLKEWARDSRNFSSKNQTDLEIEFIFVSGRQGEHDHAPPLVTARPGRLKIFCYFRDSPSLDVRALRIAMIPLKPVLILSFDIESFFSAQYRGKHGLSGLRANDIKEHLDEQELKKSLSQ